MLCVKREELVVHEATIRWLVAWSHVQQTKKRISRGGAEIAEVRDSFSLSASSAPPREILLSVTRALQNRAGNRSRASSSSTGFDPRERRGQLAHLPDRGG